MIYWIKSIKKERINKNRSDLKNKENDHFC